MPSEYMLLTVQHITGVFFYTLGGLFYIVGLYKQLNKDKHST